MAEIDRIKRIYDEVAEDYDKLYSSDLNLAEDAVLFEELGRHELGSVLDIGSGTGLLLNHLGDKITPKDYIGIEPSPKMIAVAQRNHPDHFVIQSGFEDADLGRLRFDTVLAIYGVLAYIKPEAYRRFREVMEEGGQYLLMPLNEGYTPPFESDTSAHNQDLDKLREALGDDVREIPYGFNETIFTNMDIPVDLYDRVEERLDETLQN